MIKSYSMKERKTDCLVIGGGLAGLTYASLMAEKGHSVILLDSGENSIESNSMQAQGGIVYPNETDNSSLLDDIKNATGHIANTKIIKTIIDEGKIAVDEMLIDYAKVTFDRHENGELCLTREGAHSENRRIFVVKLKGISRKFIRNCFYYNFFFP